MTRTTISGDVTSGKACVPEEGNIKNEWRHVFVIITFSLVTVIAKSSLVVENTSLVVTVIISISLEMNDVIPNTSLVMTVIITISLGMKDVIPQSLL